MKEISGAIAAIINQSSIVINKGKVDGVEKGMIFGVKLPIPDIIDPENEENILKGLYYTKGKLKVESVNDKMSFCSVLPNRILMQNNISSSIFNLANEIKEYPKITNDIMIGDDDWIISKGDGVYLIAEEEIKT